MGKNWKKTIVLALTINLCFSAIPTYAVQADEVQPVDFGVEEQQIQESEDSSSLDDLSIYEEELNYNEVYNSEQESQMVPVDVALEPPVTEEPQSEVLISSSDENISVDPGDVAAEPSVTAEPQSEVLIHLSEENLPVYDENTSIAESQPADQNSELIEQSNNEIESNDTINTEDVADAAEPSVTEEPQSEVLIPSSDENTPVYDENTSIAESQPVDSDNEFIVLSDNQIENTEMYNAEDVVDAAELSANNSQIPEDVVPEITEETQSEVPVAPSDENTVVNDENTIVYDENTVVTESQSVDLNSETIYLEEEDKLGSLTGEDQEEEQEAFEAMESIEVSELQTVWIEGESIDFSDLGLAEPDTLLDGYFNNALRGPRLRGGYSSGSALEGNNLTAYYAMKNGVAAVARGSQDSTAFSIPVSELGWNRGEEGITEADLGLSGPVNYQNESGEWQVNNGVLTEAQDKIMAIISTDLHAVMVALSRDCPYELYWWAKSIQRSGVSIGWRTSSRGYYNDQSVFIATEKTTTFYLQSADVVYYFSIDPYYRGAGENQVDTAKTTAASTAAATAQSIANNAYGTDEEILTYFRNYICGEVAYDHYAAEHGSAEVGYSPWQLINVFDGNYDTNVVCEGYSKAFRLLCDLCPNFSGYCITVTGWMDGGTGAGAHMWNLVNVDGKNYMIDVTNCDTGSIGSPDKLFMQYPASGSWNTGYVFYPNGSTITYTYDEDTNGAYNESMLTLYDGVEIPHTHVLSKVERQEATCVATGNIEYWVCSDCVSLFADENATTELTAEQIVIPINPDAHDWGEWVVTDPATCENSGTETRVCNHNAEHKGIRTIDPLGHSLEKRDARAATCITPGHIEYYECSACHKCFSDEAGAAELTDDEIVVPIDENAHDWSDWVVTTPATCSTEGQQTRTCMNDPEHIETQNIGTIAHTLIKTEMKEPTSNEPGNIAYWTCSVCHKIFADENAETEISIDETVIPISANPESDFEILYKYDESVEITGYIGDRTDVVIPGIIYGKNVTSIGTLAFYNCRSLTSITIPDGVTSIGDSAFDGCSSLTNITIPESVTSIGDSAFRECSSLTNITIPEGLTSIGEYAFFSCSSLTSITIPDGVTSIGYMAFSECSSLTSIMIPDSVTSIGDSAFFSCSSLTSITIPEGVKSIGGCTFYGCSNLTRITIPESVMSIEYRAFEGCSSLTSISIPEGVTSIEYGVFDGCNSLASITIPESVTSIGKSAFVSCKLTSITIPDSVTSIGDSAFSSCSSLTNITIPDSVTSIGEYTFSGCSSLTSIIIPEGVTSIGEHAFSSCNSLASITIPEGVTSIGDYAFYSCSNLKTVTIPENVEAIEFGAFAYCSLLKEVLFIGDRPDTIGSNIFENDELTAYYPISNSTWTEDALDNYGGSVTWETLCTNKEKHSYITDQAIAPTCTGTGLTEGMHCSVCGTVLVEQEIIPKLIDISTADIAISFTSSIYSGNPIEPSVNVSLDGESLIIDQDYTVSYMNNINVGEATVVITGTGLYGGSVNRTFTIEPKAITPAVTLSATSYTYNGTAKKPTVTVKDGTETLSASNYTVAYSNNTNAGTATVTVTMKGNYSGGASMTFAINAKAITPAVTLSATSYTYNGAPNKPTVTVKDGTTTLTASNYTVAYSNNTNAGTATVKVTMKGNYSGTASKTFTIKAKAITPAVTLSATSYTYNGSAKKPTVTVKDGTTTLAAANYTVAYSNNTNAGTATVKVTMKGNYSGSASKTFTIKAKAITPAVTLSATSYTYSGTAKKPTVTVKDGTTTLAAANYTVAYSNNTNAGTATVKVTMKGNYSGTASKTFTIKAKAITPAVTLSATSYTYSGTAKKPTVTVKTGTTTLAASNYTVAYSNNTNAGTATVKVTMKGNYSGTASKTFTIKAKAITPAVTLSATSYTYSGTAKKPAVTVKTGTTTLAASNYTVTYSNNTKAGTATVKVTMKGNYSGSASKTFTIKAKAITPAVTLSATSYTYSGTAKKPTVTVKTGSTTLASGNYTVTYSNNTNPGTATVKVTMKGNYSGSKSVTFKILPKGTAVSTLTALSKGFTVKWTKQATQTTGYQIQYSTTKGFTSGNKAVTVTSNSTVSKKITGLTSGKTYYVRIRTYKTVSGKNYYSAWSAVKSVKAK